MGLIRIVPLAILLICTHRIVLFYTAYYDNMTYRFISKISYDTNQTLNLREEYRRCSTFLLLFAMIGGKWVVGIGQRLGSMTIVR